MQQPEQCSFYHQFVEDVVRTAGAHLLCKPGRVKAVLLLAVLRHVVRHWLLRCLGTLPGRICASPRSSICIMGCRMSCNSQLSSIGIRSFMPYVQQLHPRQQPFR